MKTLSSVLVVPRIAALPGLHGRVPSGITQLLLLGRFLLIISVSVPLVFLALYLVRRAARGVTHDLVQVRERRAATHWVAAQRLAELEEANGHGVLYDGSCPTCQAELVLGAHYCCACGCAAGEEARPHVVVCPFCYVTNPLSGRFCAACGRTLPELATARTRC